MNEYDISEAFRRIENDLIDSLIRNLSRHRAEEEKEGYNWDAWQTAQLRELEKYRRDNAHRFDNDFKDIHNAITDLMIKEFQNGVGGDWTNPEIAEWRNLESILGLSPYQPRSNLIGINSGRLDALLEATQNDLEKAEHAVLRKANDEYRKIIFDAQVYADQGGTYEQAVDMATRDFRKRGIQSIVYKNGARHNISDYAEMALRTGGKRAYLMGLGQQMARIGVHTVIVHRRNGACPFCTPWLGKVLVDDVYNEGTEEEARRKGLPLLSEAIDKGFLHPNCKDIYSMYIEGVTKPEEPLTDEEKDLMQKVYDLEQELKKAEGIRDSYIRMANGSLDPKESQNYWVLSAKWNEKAQELRNQLAELRKQLPRDILDEVPPINHSGIRELIEVERDTVTRGLFEVPDGVLKIGDRLDDLNYSWSDRKIERWNVSLNKQVSLPWEGFGKQGKNTLRWTLPDYRYEKPFLLQKKDFEYRTLDKVYQDGKLREDKITKWFKDNGYDYIGYVNTSKYNTPWKVSIGQKDGKYYFVLDDMVEEDGVVKKSTIDKILEREKIVSKQLWDEGVRFRELTARRGDEWNQAMVKFHTAVEADRPASLVSRKAYDELDGEQLYRGIAPVSHLRSDLTMVKTPVECAEQLMEGGVGDCFPSRGIYGDGVAYASNSVQTGRNYATGYGSSEKGCIAVFKIKDDARIIDYDDAVRLFEEIADAHPKDGSPYFNRQQVGSSHEVGKAMQMLGYDIIYQPRGDGMNVHFYIILNRDAIVGISDDYIMRL